MDFSHRSCFFYSCVLIDFESSFHRVSFWVLLSPWRALSPPSIMVGFKSFIIVDFSHRSCFLDSCVLIDFESLFHRGIFWVLLSLWQSSSPPFVIVGFESFLYSGKFKVLLPLWWASSPSSVIIYFESFHYGGLWVLPSLWRILSPSHTMVGFRSFLYYSRFCILLPSWWTSSRPSIVIEFGFSSPHGKLCPKVPQLMTPSALDMGETW